MRWTRPQQLTLHYAQIPYSLSVQRQGNIPGTQGYCQGEFSFTLMSDCHWFQLFLHTHLLEAVTSNYISNKDNSDKSIRGLIHKKMREIVNGLSVPNDMSSYLLEGSKMKRGDKSDTKKCSLTSIRLGTLASDNNESSSSFTWQKITKGIKHGEK